MKHERQLSECEGKQRHTRPQAIALAERQRRKGASVEAYKCSICKKHHIGRITKTPKPLHDGPRKISPTPERQAKGVFKKVGGKAASVRYAVDVSAHPIDALRHTKQISQQQFEAAQDFEEAYRNALQVPGIRDSCTIWEPQGHQSDDGNPRAVALYRALSRRLTMIGESRMQSVIIYLTPPRNDRELGELREALNEAHRFFTNGR